MSEHPKMGQRVVLEGYVNGYSTNREGKDERPIVSVFLPDGHRGFHGPSGTTIWLTLAEFEALTLRKELAKGEADV